MAVVKKAYSRPTVKKIVKAHSNCSTTKNLDVLIYLDYLRFMQSIVKEAAIESKKTGEKAITSTSVRKATLDALGKFKG